MEAQVIRLLFVAVLLGPGQGVGDAVGIDRVGAQKFRGAEVTGVAGLAQPFEKARHGEGVVAGARQGGDADAVGLFLVVAGEIDPSLDGQALETGDGRRPGVDVHLGAEDGGGDHQQGGGNGELLLVLEGAQ